MSGSDLSLFLTLVGFLVTVGGVLIFFLFEDRKRSEVVNKLEAKIDKLEFSTTNLSTSVREESSHFDRAAREYLTSASAVAKEIIDIRSAYQQLRPDFAVFVANQWRIFDRMARYRHEKLLICRTIVMNHISTGDTVLLDSGSTTDQFTSELLLKPAKGINIFSNNVLSALHLAGTSSVRFYLLGGQVFERSWAVYSDEVNGRMDQLGITVFVIAGAAFRFNDGVYYRTGEDGNKHFKKAALLAFGRTKDTRLVLALDASKFTQPLAGHSPVLSRNEWSQMVRTSGDRITIITSETPNDVGSDVQKVAIEREIAKCRDAGLKVEVASSTSI
jgi:DeoR/GlpR family transcriptional regulator of sugar metabolism